MQIALRLYTIKNSILDHLPTEGQWQHCTACLCMCLHTPWNYFPFSPSCSVLGKVLVELNFMMFRPWLIRTWISIFRPGGRDKDLDFKKALMTHGTVYLPFFGAYGYIYELQIKCLIFIVESKRTGFSLSVLK